MKKMKYISSIPRTVIVALCFLLVATGCKKNEISEDTAEKKNVNNPVAKLEVYKPRSMKNMDWNSVESEWSYSRSQQSDHFIVFWAKGYGENKPSSQLVNSKYRVDIDDLLSKAEEYYKLNVDVLKFAILGNGSSKLEKYKLMIFLYYEDTWRATGLGYDDTIGALWISPATCHPVGTTVAHEIGHSFQYQVACDLGTGHGFRWGFSGNGAGNNGFWEQTAQWQAFNSYPNEFFGSWFSSYTQNYHKHLLHEDYRYNNCMIHQFWAQKRGIAFIGRIWRESKAYEDPIQTYQRLNGLTLEQLHDEMYEASTRFVTWDTDNLRTLGAKSIGSHRYKMNQMPDGSFQPDPSFCPQTTGYNVIPLEVPVGGTLVSADFQGIPNAPGYNPVDATVAGWRYGFVALLNDGSRVYSAKNSNKTGSATFVVPDNCSRLWFVVTGAPSKYDQHAWDSNNSNDMQWPYKVKFQNTNLPGYNNQLPKDVSFQYDISVSRSTSNYDYAAVNVDVVKLAAAFQMPKEEITKNMGTLIKFYAIEPNGSLNPTTTANGYGHWFDGAGKVTSFGANARVFSEFDAQNFRYKAGQYPGRLSSGDKFQMREMLIYTPPSGNKVSASFTINLTII